MARELRATYGYADLGRAGLANKLFPWARCLIWCRAHGIRMLPPRFFQTPIGPLLRGERDLRLYGNLFRMPPVSEWGRRAVALRLLPHENESRDQQFATPVRQGRVYRFAGLGAYFRTLNDSRELVAESLMHEVHPRWQREINRQSAPLIGVHVRLGDFSGNMLHPVEWYADALRFVRQVAGWPVPARVFSDGRPDELAALLQLEATSLVTGTNAIVDMFVLARSRFLIGTGSSTFSAWAEYLGQMPALTRQGNPFSWWKLENRRGHFIGEVDFNAPPEPLIRDIQESIGRRDAA